MSLRSVIISEMQAIAAENNKTLPVLDDGVELLDTEFDSLCFALLVARMEDRTGLDPFSTMAVADLPVTVADLVALYDDAVAQEAA